MPSPTPVAIELVREPDFILERSMTKIVLTGTRFAMPAFDPATWSTRDLTIRAYDLTLVEDLHLPGRNVVIACKILRVPRPTRISVSGRDGADHLVPANDGHEQGAHGVNGLDGRPGQHAGSITLIADEIEGELLSLEANGGNGGAGQKGGNGQKGRTGKNGADGSKEGGGTKHGERGQDGRVGGNAGTGGAGGAAGNGGTISIFVRGGGADGQIAASAEPGTPGRPGKAGTPGTGGNPGVGGLTYHCYSESPGIHG